MGKSIRNPHIFCLESMWAESPNLPRQSVYPLLQILQMEYNINIAHLNCNTLDEFEHNLEFAKKRYGIIYLAFHGEPGNLVFQNQAKLSVEELSDLMSKGFSDSGVHFASCGTLGIPKSRITNFIEKTGVSFVSGYKKPVYWIPSAAVDLVYLESLIDNFGNISKAVEKMKSQIVPSTKNLGFTFID